MSTYRMLPSAFSYSVGAPKWASFAAQYLARTCPCQRFGAVLTDGATA